MHPQSAWHSVHFILVFLLTVGPACNRPPVSAGPQEQDETAVEPQASDLLAKDQIDLWKPAEFGGQGEIEVTENRIRLDFGYTMTGATYHGEFPTNNYRLEFEARRVEGSDFFATTTFPVNQSHCSLVTGGWGGAIFGLSNVDDEDASQNATKTIFGFQQDEWYQFSIEVHESRIKCWVNKEKLIDIEISDKKIALRPDVSVCKPLGFCSYETVGEIRNVKLIKLDTESEEKIDD